YGTASLGSSTFSENGSNNPAKSTLLPAAGGEYGYLFGLVAELILTVAVPVGFDGLIALLPKYWVKVTAPGFTVENGEPKPGTPKFGESEMPASIRLNGGASRFCRVSSSSDRLK